MSPGAGAVGPRRWLVVSVLPPPRGEELLLVDALRRLGARAVEREGERFAALFPPPERVEALVAEVRAAVRASTRLSDPAPAWRWQSHEEWSARWRRERAPRRVTRRIVVAPADAGAPPGPGTGVDGAGDVVIRLEPAVAFGTAEHASTRAALGFLDGGVRNGDRVLDIGAGSAILAIAAVRLGAVRALAVEADPVACAAARRNVALNGVADRVRVRELEVRPGRLGRLGRHDLVVANLEGHILLPLVPSLPAAMAPRGRLFLAGLLRSEREPALSAARAAGLAAEGETAEGGWWAASFVRV